MQAITRAIKYWLVSGATFALNILISWFFFEIVGWHYVIAILIGFTVETILSFFINRTWTFHRPLLGTGLGLFRTTIVQAIVLFIGITGTTIGMDIGFSFVMSRILAGIVAGLLAYILDSLFTFRVALLK